MSHVAVRIVANWLNDATYGVNAIAAVVPRDVGDAAPPTAYVYDETRQGWVARTQLVRSLGVSINTPAVLVWLMAGEFDGGVPDAQDTGARTENGNVQIAVQLIMTDATTEHAATEGMYLLRAIRNSLLQLNDPSRESDRTDLGVRLQPSTSVKQGKLDGPNDDKIVSVGAFLVTYDTIEVTALTLP